MVGWLYIDNLVAAPIRMLDTDTSSGMLSLAIAEKFVTRPLVLRNHTVIEYQNWAERREVRCLSVESVGGVLLIDAVDLGNDRRAESPCGSPAEDWLVIDGQAVDLVHGFRAGDQVGQTPGHCLMQVPLNVWRDLRIGADAPLAGVGILAGVGDETGSITPLLQRTDEPTIKERSVTIEVVRLRERQRYLVVPIATDWSEDATVVVCRVDGVSGLG